MRLKLCRHFPLIGLLAGALSVSVVLFFFMNRQTDTPTYEAAVRVWWGEAETQDRLYRLSKPLALALPVALYGCGLEPYWGLLVQQWLCYLLCGALAFRTLNNWYGEERAALLGTALYLGCQPAAVFGTAALTDAAGWAAAWALLWWAWRLEQSPKPRLPYWGLWGAALGLGVFVKESALAAGAWWGVWLLVQPRATPWRRRALKALYALSGFAGAVGTGLWATRQAFGYNLLDWIAFNHTDPPPFGLKGHLLQTYRTLDVFWLLLPLALWAAWRKKMFSNALWLSLLLSGILAPLLYPLVWRYSMDRILFLFAPFWLGLLCQVWSLLPRCGGVLAGVGALLNWGAVWAIYARGAQGALLAANMVFALLLVWALWAERRRAISTT